MREFTLVEGRCYSTRQKFGIQRRVPVELTALPSNSLVCLGVDPLVAWCKHVPKMLFAKLDEQSRLGSFQTEGIHDAGTARLCRLCEAWAFDPARGDAEPASGIVGTGTYIWVTNVILHDLNKALPNEDHDVRRIASCTIERTFAYVDVSGFSKYKPGQQALIINTLVFLVGQQDFWGGRGQLVQQAIQARMCLGDGYIFVFRKAMDGAYFAAYLAQLIEELAARKVLPVEFHFRMGVHVGEVYTFWDPGRNDWNYIGDGINGGSRVLTAIDKSYDDQVYISGDVRKAIMACSSADADAPRLMTNLHNRGSRRDKHDRPWRVYEIAHTAVCSADLSQAKLPPPRD